MLSFLTCAVLLLSSSSANGQNVRIYAPTDSVEIGSRFNIQIVVEHSPESDLLVPIPESSGTSLGDIELLELAEHPTRNFDRGGQVVRVDSAVYTAAAFAVDSAFVPPLQVRVVQGADTVAFETPSLYIPILSKVPEDSQEMMDLAPLTTFPWPWWLYLAGALLILSLLSLIYYLIKRRQSRTSDEPVKTHTIKKTPFQIAMERLKKLENHELSTEEMIKTYYVELSDAVREYIDQRLDIPAPEQTSADLIRNMNALSRRTTGLIPQRALDLLKPILSEADLAKFADFQPDSNTSAETLAHSKDLVRTIETSIEERDALLAQSLNPDHVRPQGANQETVGQNS